MDDVKQFFKTYYAPNNAVLALVGDLDTKETLAKVKKYFGSIPRQTPPVPADLTEPAKDGERRGTLDDPLARLTRIDIAYRIPPSSTPDARALSAAAQMLGGGGGGFGGRGGGGGGNNSRLYLKLVQEKSWRRVSPAIPTGASVPGHSTSLPLCVPARPPRRWKG